MEALTCYENRLQKCKVTTVLGCMFESGTFQEKKGHGSRNDYDSSMVILHYNIVQFLQNISIRSKVINDKT